jgi:hypothetical protein
MRRLPLLLVTLLAAPIAAEDTPKPKAEEHEAAYEWRPAEAHDVPAAVKTALIGESEKLAGDAEITGFGFAQTPFDAKEQRFRATFQVGDRSYVLTCKIDGSDLKNESAGQPKAGDAK